MSGLQDDANKEICPIELGHKGTKSHGTGSVAAGQYVTAYMVEASLALQRKMAAQEFRHLAWFEDSSKIGTHEVGRLCFHCSFHE